MKITEKQIKNSTASVEVVVSPTEMDKIKESVVDEMIQSVTVKGFRQGKAPKSIAQKNLDPEKLNNHIVNHLLNKVVIEIINEKKYQTLGRPVLDKLENTKDNDVKLELSFPLYPTFKLGKYKDSLKKAKIKNQDINTIYETLLKNTKIEVSNHLVEEEAHQAMHRLEEQAKTLNLTTDKYLEAIKKTREEVKKEYEKSALESIKLDLILLEIAKEENISADKKEVDGLMTSLGGDQSQLERVKNIITRHKTIDFLKNLVK